MAQQCRREADPSKRHNQKDNKRSQNRIRCRIPQDTDEHQGDIQAEGTIFMIMPCSILVESLQKAR